MPEVVDLKNRPEFLEPIAHWHQNEWQHLNPGETLEQRIQRMQYYLSANFIPSMFIAVNNDQLLGTAAIVEHDMETHQELSPWLASVFVDPLYRRQGTGSALVKHVMLQAEDRAVEKLYLFTPDKENFYRRFGWSVLSRETYHDEQVVIMQKHLK